MLRKSVTLALVAFAIAATAMPADAQVKDALYRGTLVCSPLPFLKGYLRGLMDLTIKGPSAEYRQPVINAEKGTLIGWETGSGTVDGTQVKLTGMWRGDSDSIEATYSGAIVRRTVRLSGTQIWTHEGKAYTRTCSGKIKRPFAVIMRMQKR